MFETARVADAGSRPEPDSYSSGQAVSGAEAATVETKSQKPGLRVCAELPERRVATGRLGVLYTLREITGTT